MQEVTLALSIIALAVSAYAVWTLVKVVKTLEDLVQTVSNATDRIEDIGDEVHRQQKAIKQLEASAARPALGAPMDVVPFLLTQAGKGQWTPVVAVAVKLFAAYWKRRSAKTNAGPKAIDAE